MENSGQRRYKQGELSLMTHPIARGRVYEYRKTGIGGDLHFSRPNETGEDAALIVARDFTGLEPIEGAYGVIEFFNFLKNSFPWMELPDIRGNESLAMKYASKFCIENNVAAGFCAIHEVAYDLTKRMGCPLCEE